MPDSNSITIPSTGNYEIELFCTLGIDTTNVTFGAAILDASDNVIIQITNRAPSSTNSPQSIGGKTTINLTAGTILTPVL
jgi:hypothetical protein